MAIADVVTSGFGSFSSVNKVPTRGFSIGAAAEGIEAFDLEWRVVNTSPEYRLANTSPEYRVEEQ